MNRSLTRLSAFVVVASVFASACAAPAAPAAAPTAVPPTAAPAATVAPEPTVAPTEAPKMETKDIVDTAVGAGTFNTLAAALTAAGLVDTLKGAGPFTVFAPTDEAFAKLDKTLLANLLKPENKEALTKILTYHVVAGKVMAADVVKMTSAKTVEGSEAKIKVDGSTVMIDGAKVTATDIVASNGIIHVIDAVIVPASVDVSKLAMAPAMTGTEAMTQTEMMTDTKAMTDTMKAEMDIVDTAVAAGNFKTLAAALTAAGLIDTLKGEGPFTVFAPTDEAFAKLDKATLADLLKPENKEKLVAILTYHVVPGSVMAADVVKLTSAKTVNGAEVKIKVDGSTVMVNDAKVTATDIKAKNGVIHVIDTVILPPAK
jgi:transforming growth factor-beta-induced protein